MATDNLVKKTVQTVNIRFKDLTYQVPVLRSKNKKVVLNGISGTFKAGQLAAIMGPSGAGKSTLMNILTGFIKKGVSGTIDVGGSVKSRKLCCYIMQDDYFYPWLTVSESMMLSAALKISNKSMNMMEKQLLVEKILDTLKLSRTKRTKCSNLSGGQMKRLSIALELIDNPPILFLDEPTTGLDSSACFDTIQLLQFLATEGRTIVCTIHQPSSNIYSLFNQIYILSAGHCVYQGTPSNTVPFLKMQNLQCPDYHNPADFVLECVTGEYGDYTVALTEEAKNAKWHYDHDYQSTASLYHDSNSDDLTHSRPPSSLGLETARHTYPPPEWIRLWLLIGRCHVQFFRDWTVTYLKFAVHIVCAILVGLIFSGMGMNAKEQISNMSSFLVHCVYLWYTTMMPGVLRFPQEIQIIKKETFNNWYKLRTYYIAALVTSTPLHIISSSAYITITYLLTEQPLELERFTKFILTAVIMTLCADGFGVFLGTVLNPVNGTFIGAILTCFMLIYSGFLILFTHMSQIMNFVSYFSPLRYAMECMILSIYGNNRENTICPPNVLYCHFRSATTILQLFGMENGSFEFNISMLLLIIAVVKGSAYFTLKRKISKE